MTSANLELWAKFEDIDPKFTKAITGKSYRGTSPNPQYVIRCLTEMFGPAGDGFGWEVVDDGFRDFQDGTVLHWCRIDFWHRADSGQCRFQEYGQTKAAFTTKNGTYMVDEDAPKKSLTDAIIKAASHLGIAANIFMGRWDDQKYVDSVNSEYREAEKKANPVPPEVMDAIGGAETLESLAKVWHANREWQTHPDFLAEKNRRKLELERAA